jgi:hypothetical protein
MAFYAKCCQASPTYTALHDPWCYFISGLRRVSLAEYILIFRVYSLLFQMICCTMGTVRIVFTLLWMKIRPWGMVSLSYLTYDAFVGNDHGTSM